MKTLAIVMVIGAVLAGIAAGQEVKRAMDDAARPYVHQSITGR